MKFTLSWLKEFLEFDNSLEEIVDALTNCGLEVDSVINKAKGLEDIKIAEIIESKPHPNADKLKVCKVNNGKEILQIVCGAPNARTGIKVALAEIGTYINNIDLKIKKTSIREIESNGMLCSKRELGLGIDHEGIMELTNEAVIGTRLIDHLELDDPIIELEITPNRGDALSVYGIARDLYAVGIGKLKQLDLTDIKEEISDNIEIELEDDNCYLFVARYISDIQNNESPNWLKKRLESIGQNSINALVDITNYVMLSYGRPLHAYDADKIGKKLKINKSKKDENFTSLNGEKFILTSETTVIRNEQEILAIAGVIGGENSGCNKDTKNCILEAAVFDPVTVSNAGRRYNIITDSRYRFERGVDHNFTKEGAIIACKLIQEICKAKFSKFILKGKEKLEEKTTILRKSKFTQLIGLELSIDTIAKILISLGFKVISQDQEKIEVIIPSWRNDINTERNLIQEVIRIYGLDKVKPESIVEFKEIEIGKALSEDRIREGKTKKILASLGLNEVVSWSFMNKSEASNFGDIREDLILLNPISEDLNYMRNSILPNLINMAHANLNRSQKEVNLFEVGPIYLGNQLKDQHIIAAGLRAGIKSPNHYLDSKEVSWLNAKTDLFMLVENLGFDSSKLQIDTEVPNYFHPGQSGRIKLGKNIIGYFGAIHPHIKKLYEIKDNLVAFEIYLDKLPYSNNSKTQKPKLELSNLPVVNRRFSFIVPENISFSDILVLIKKANIKFIDNIDLFDYPTNIKLEDNSKIMGINISLQPEDKTFTSEEIDDFSNKIISNIEISGAKLRNA